MTTFAEMVTRVATQLRRTDASFTADIQLALNNAIEEASRNRFYFNEVRGLTFNTVVGTEYYDDLGIVEIDAIYYFNGASKFNLDRLNDLDATNRFDGTPASGNPLEYSRQGTSLRLYPVPSSVKAIYMEGVSRLTPFPFVSPTNDAHTNAWFSEGEQYIRALAKSIFTRDVVRDYSEATVLEAIAEDRKSVLIDATNGRFGTGVITPTQF